MANAAEDLGFLTHISQPEGANAPMLELSIDNATSEPYLCLPQKLHRQLYDLADNSQLRNSLETPEQFESGCVQHLRDVIQGNPRSMSQNIAYGLRQPWSALTYHASTLNRVAEGQHTSNEQLPGQYALRATASRVELCQDFAFGAIGLCDGRPVNIENPSFRTLCQQHGVAAAMRIANHYRATVESPLWHFLFPDTGALPAAYDASFREYAGTVRQNAIDPNNLGYFDPNSGSFQNVSVPPLNILMGNTSDKLDQDIGLCKRMIDLSKLEQAAVQERRDFLSTAPNAQSTEIREQINLLDQEATHVARKIQSLERMGSVLRIAQVTPELQQQMETHGYAATLNAACDLWETHGYPEPPGRNELEETSIATRSRLFLSMLPYRTAELEIAGQMNAVERRLAEPSLSVELRTDYERQYEALQRKAEQKLVIQIDAAHQRLAEPSLSAELRTDYERQYDALQRRAEQKLVIQVNQRLAEPSLSLEMRAEYERQHEGLKRKHFDLAQLADASALAKNSRPFIEIARARGLEHAEELALGAWRVAMEASFGDGLMINNRPATQADVFDAVLCWMCVMQDKDGPQSDSPRGADAAPWIEHAINNKTLAHAVVERFQHRRETEWARHAAGENPYQLEEWPGRLLHVIESYGAQTSAP